MRSVDIHINGDRLASELETLATFSAAPPPAVTRVVFSPEDLAARSWFKQLCLDAALEVREDAVGNTFARWTGDDAGLPPVGTGSHIDAIPYSGRYDGTVGVLGGLEAIRALRRTGFRPKRSIELVMFTSEEPTRFGIGCLGSRLLSGATAVDAVRELKDRDGNTVEQVCHQAGFSGSLDSVRIEEGHYAAFIELHIEQGPHLERNRIPIGVVVSIAAPASARISIEGQGGHAGAVLMPDRHDAFLAAAEIALTVEAAAKSTGAIDTVATTGVCNVFPGAVNSIPSRVEIEIDFRDTDLSRRDRVFDAIRASSDDVARRRGVEVKLVLINADRPAQSSPAIINAVTEACEQHGLECVPMVSRAYHDTLFMSRIAPSAMIFIPCRGGVSHRPDEYASDVDIVNGTTILAHALARLCMVEQVS
jgi:N-carbamoyl-L-amino-acid hydrolase